MVIEKHFIKENVQKLVVRKYIEENLSKVGCGSVDISRSPLGMRVTIYAEKPGLIIGRKGKSIQKLTDALRDNFKLENPQIEVLEIPKPELNAVLMAQRIASSIERGTHFRRAVYSTMQSIQRAGALGVEVTVSGKMSGERARSSKFTSGFIKHSGECKERITQDGFAAAKLKPGIMGIKVKLTPPDAVTSEIRIRAPIVVQAAPAVVAPTALVPAAPTAVAAVPVATAIAEVKIAAAGIAPAGAAEAVPETQLVEMPEGPSVEPAPFAGAAEPAEIKPAAEKPKAEAKAEAKQAKDAAAKKPKNAAPAKAKKEKKEGE